MASNENLTEGSCECCRYDLRGLRQRGVRVCPECGNDLRGPAIPSLARAFMSQYWMAMIPCWIAIAVLTVAAMPKTGVPGQLFLREHFRVIVLLSAVLFFGWPWVYCMFKSTKTVGNAACVYLVMLAVNIGMLMIGCLVWIVSFDLLGGS